jgi:hypothetical protein
MPSTRIRASRAAVATIAMAGALGLSACQDGSVDSAPPTSAAPTTDGADSQSSATQAPASSAAPETSESSSSESSSSSAPAGNAGDTTTTPKGTTLKFGQPANLRESSTSEDADGYRVQVDGLDKAPDSVYSGQVTKANGTVYYLRYTVTNTGQDKSSMFDAGDVNGFMLIPNLAPGQKAKKILGSAPGCESEDNQLSVGQSGKGCDAYQVEGADVSEVVWRPGLTTVVTWTK